MSERDFSLIADHADIVAMYARGALIHRHNETMKAHEVESFDRTLKNLAVAAGYRLVPANDKELADVE